MSDAPGGTTFRAWEGFALWLLVFVVAGFTYGTFCDRSCADGTASDPRLIAGLALLPVLFLVLTWVWMRALHRTGLGATGLRRPTWQAVWTGIGYGLGGRVLAAVTEAVTLQVVESIRGEEPDVPAQIGLPARPSVVFWIGVGVAVIVLAPIAEEIVFRGLTYLGLRAAGGPLTAIAISSAFFAVTHIEPLIMPALFVLAVVLARLRESRDDLTPCIVAHATFNVVGFVALILTA